jgi:hypothetical protein
MCLNCGCGDPTDDRGKPENLTIDDLQRAAWANGQSLGESARHILDTVVAFESRRRADVAGAPERKRDGGLAEPAGKVPAPPAPRGTPETES